MTEMTEGIVVLTVLALAWGIQGGLIGFLNDREDVFRARIALLSTKFCAIGLFVAAMLMVAIIKPAHAIDGGGSSARKGTAYVLGPFLQAISPQVVKETTRRGVVESRAQKAPPLPITFAFVPFWVIREDEVEEPECVEMYHGPSGTSRRGGEVTLRGALRVRSSGSRLERSGRRTGRAKF